MVEAARQEWPRGSVDALIRGGSSATAEANGQADELSPGARVAANGGFDGGARGDLSRTPADFGSTLDAAMRGAAAEKRERQVHRGGGSISRPRGHNGIR
ncbi:MAG TPA: hypothetical protein VIM33_06565 [Gaiellaceae bacterium]|jgi:hypothetical protein